MIDCEQKVRLDAYHDGELSSVERADVEAHLRGCPSCAAALVAMRGFSRAFADAAPPEPSDDQLMELARGVRAEQSEARMLLRLFRITAVAAALLLACALATAAFLSRQAKAAAHEAMVLDHVTAWSQQASAATLATGPIRDARRAEGRVLLAQWIADDLRGRRQEER